MDITAGLFSKDRERQLFSALTNLPALWSFGLATGAFARITHPFSQQNFSETWTAEANTCI